MTETLVIDKEKVNLFMQEVGIKRYSELAEKADLHPNTLTKVLRGEGWTSETAIKLARVLHCNPIDLQTAKGYEDPKSDTLVGPSVLEISFLNAVVA